MMKKLLIVCMLASGFTMSMLPLASHAVTIDYYVHAYKVKVMSNNSFIYFAVESDKDDYINSHPGTVYLGIYYVPASQVIQLPAAP